MPKKKKKTFVKIYPELDLFGDPPKSNIPKLSPLLWTRQSAYGIEYTLNKFLFALSAGESTGVKEFYFESDRMDVWFPAIARCALMGALLTGDLEWFDQVRNDVQSYGERADVRFAKPAAELVDAWLRSSLQVRVGYPEWLLKLEFSSLPDVWRFEAMRIAATALSVCGSHVEAETAARLVLALPSSIQPFDEWKIPMALVCAQSSTARQDFDAARGWYRQVVSFAEKNSILFPILFGDLGLDFIRLAFCTDKASLFHRRIVSESTRLFDTFLAMRNRVYGKDAMCGLTRREFEIAQMLSRKESYGQVAAQLGVSVGRVRNLVSELYGKLSVHRRNELTTCVY